jgi:D-alanine-D-alanine ligase
MPATRSGFDHGRMQTALAGSDLPPSPDGRSRIRVAVIFGGRNGEHDVSCRSALAVLRFLDYARYEAVPLLITREGAWVVGTALRSAPDDLVMPGTGPAGSSAAAGLADALHSLRSADVAFPCLHGPYGEDGRLQGLLEFAGVPYVGSGVLAGAATMDKEFTKKIVAAEGIAVADGVVLRAGGTDIDVPTRARLGLPVFVKPARSGSSVGVSRVGDWADLTAAVTVARQWDDKVLVEAAVAGREVDVALLQRPDGEVVAGPPLEIEVSGGGAFFDFDAKYRAGGARFVVPAELPPATAARLVDAAHRAFDALGCRGLLRADFFLPEVDGELTPVLNEVNALPGLTELSQFPLIWAAAGLSYPDLVDCLLSTALADRAGRR